MRSKPVNKYFLDDDKNLTSRIYQQLYLNNPMKNDRNLLLKNPLLVFYSNISIKLYLFLFWVLIRYASWVVYHKTVVGGGTLFHIKGILSSKFWFL